MMATGRQIAFLMSLLVIVSADVVPSKTSGQTDPSQAIAHTSICLDAVGLVPVVILPLIRKSSNPSVVLSMIDDSIPASKLVSLASEATAAVSVVFDPYFVNMLFGI